MFGHTFSAQFKTYMYVLHAALVLDGKLVLGEFYHDSSVLLD